MDNQVKVIDDQKLQEVIAFEQSKINALSIISDEQRQILCQSAKFTAIPYMPISKPFIQNYILNNVEYPLLESKLSQSATEMKSRFNRIIESNFQFEKESLELQELELDLEDLKNQQVLPKGEKRLQIQISKKQLDIQNKKWRIISIKHDLDSTFKEFNNWYETINELIDGIKSQDPSIESFKDINYDAIRMVEMAIKVKRWEILEKAGQELTPSQKIFTVDKKLSEQPLENPIPQQPDSNIQFFDFNKNS